MARKWKDVRAEALAAGKIDEQHVAEKAEQTRAEAVAEAMDEVFTENAGLFDRLADYDKATEADDETFEYAVDHVFTERSELFHRLDDN